MTHSLKEYRSLQKFGRHQLHWRDGHKTNMPTDEHVMIQRRQQNVKMHIKCQCKSELMREKGGVGEEGT